MSRGLIWFRSDLRIADNAALTAAGIQTLGEHNLIKSYRGPNGGY